MVTYLRENAADLIDAMDMDRVLSDLAIRCDDRDHQAEYRLTSGILPGSGDAMNVDARDFNRAAEKFYREQLRQQNLSEACAHLRQDAESLQRCQRSEVRACLRHGVRVQDASRFVADIEARTLSDQLSLQEITTLMNLLLLLALKESQRTPGNQS